MMIQSVFRMTMGLGIMVLAAGQVQARGAANCAPRDVVIERLAGLYGETRRSIGLGAQNVVIEVFASSRTGTWTITLTTPDGRTCLVASGESFEETGGTGPSERALFRPPAAP